MYVFNGLLSCFLDLRQSTRKDNNNENGRRTQILRPSPNALYIFHVGNIIS